MPRNVTSSRSSFTRAGQVTYAFTPDLDVVTISLPPCSSWTSGLHWHETHDEHFQVVKGRALITLGDVTKVYGPEEGAVTVKRGVRHEWRLPPSEAAEPNATAAAEEYAVVVKEWTDPADGQKEIFFRNLSSVLMDPPEREWLLTLQLFSIFAVLDNYPVLVKSEWSLLEWAVTHLALRAGELLGRALGMKAVYEEYTPISLWKQWSQSNKKTE